MTSFSTAVRERRSIRAFTEQPVAGELIRDLLAHAVWAPSPHNSQPWRFTVLLQDSQPPSGRHTASPKNWLAQAMAGQLARELAADGLPVEEIERQTDRSRRRIVAAPAVVLCSLVREGLVRYPDRRRDELEWQMAVQSVGAVLQTLFLLAAEQGIGSCWMAAPMYCPEIVRGVLDLPAEYCPQALALLGYPAAPGKVRERRPLGQLVDVR